MSRTEMLRERFSGEEWEQLGVYGLMKVKKYIQMIVVRMHSIGSLPKVCLCSSGQRKGMAFFSA